MKPLLIHNPGSATKGIGGKARNLARLGELGVNVPRWAVIPEHVLLDQLPDQPGPGKAGPDYEELSVPPEIQTQLADFFGEDHRKKTYAVRSSAIDEDGSRFSFAGQFKTFLHVPFDEIEDKIKDTWRSAVSERVLKYRKENNLPPEFGIGVIIQEMIEAEVSGVAFGIDPVSGDTDKKVISAVYGLGEGLVSGELDADTFTLGPDGIEEQLAHKTHAFTRDRKSSGLVKTEIEKQKRDQPALDKNRLLEIAGLLDKLSASMGAPQDIEFAYSGDKLYLLQARPVTAAGSKPKGGYILWDNSNIIESYPGVTTPLTFSFIIKMYEQVYRQFVRLMGVKDKEIEQHSDVFANTLGLVRGRVYYNLLNWYKMLAMLPGYRINAGFMENMMGVKERFELDEEYRMSKGLAWFRILMMVFRMIALHLRLPGDRKRFLEYLEETLQKYKETDFSSLPPQEIISSYKTFEEKLLLRWKAPLVNDFFAMIWFGLLQKQTGKYFPGDPNIHNDLLCGSQDIISVEPIHHSIEIANLVRQNSEAHKLFKRNSPEEVWAVLVDGGFPKIKKAVDDYLDQFGERCVGELKLETISYSREPSRFVKVIQSYLEQDISQKKLTSDIENKLREEAERKVFAALQGKPLKRRLFNYTLQKTRDLVSNRENLRYERTRAFGIVRTMFNALGEQWHKSGKLDDPRDVFYLELEEIKALENADFDSSLHQKIEERKAEFARYRKQPAPKERFFTYGMNFTDEYIYSDEKMAAVEGDLGGIGCCPGKVQAKVRVVTDPNETDSLNGDILVTSSTDPGWVTLFPTASGIIVERGSLLSHSAIVSREMGIPCIVSVSGLLRTLKSGDEVLMDGSTGKIKILDNG